MKQIIQIILVTLFTVSVSGNPPLKGPKIVGGEEAEPNEFPWIVQIQLKDPFIGYYQYCGGNIYNEEWIVTTAACADENMFDYRIVAGDHSLLVSEETEQRRLVVQIVSHPSHGSPMRFENDIAVMKVWPPFIFTDAIQPARFPDTGFIPPANVTAAGWGALFEGGYSSPTLQKVIIPVVSEAACNVSHTGQVAKSMICSGELGRDACAGDAGSPLICGNGNDSVVCGLVSWGRGCARNGYPGVSTEVSYFKDWLVNAVLSPAPVEDNSTYVEQTEGCGGILIGSSGKLDYKMNAAYDNNERCAWTIRANQREYIQLTIDPREWSLGPGDYISVTEFHRGGASDGPNIGNEYRMDNETYILRVWGPLIVVTFYSDAGETGTGFSLLFQGLGRHNQSSFLIRNHFHLGEDAGSFSYPVGGGEYQNNELASFVINTKTAFVLFEINTMELENDATCNFDALSIHDHREAEGFATNQRLCGTNVGSTVLSDGLIVLMFKTDGSGTLSGFSFSWVGTNELR